MYEFCGPAGRYRRLGCAAVAVVAGAGVATAGGAAAGDLSAPAATATVSASVATTGGGDAGGPALRLPAFVGAGAIEQMKASIAGFWRLPVEGLADFAETVRRAGSGGSAASPTSDAARASDPDGVGGRRFGELASTLSDARRDAGEVRALSDEVRLRADELSRRFSIGTWAMGSGAAAAATIPAFAAADTADERASSVAMQTSVRASPDQNPFRDLIESLAAPRPVAPDFSSQMGLGSTPATETAGSGAAGTNAVPRAHQNGNSAKQGGVTPAVVTRPVDRSEKAVGTGSLAPHAAPLPARPRRAKLTNRTSRPPIAARADAAPSIGW